MSDREKIARVREYLRAAATFRNPRGVRLSPATARAIADWLDDYAEILDHLPADAEDVA